MNKSTQGSTAAEYKTETITLKRHDKKKWQYEDCEVTRVEWAVVDYLKAKGWNGYFTEHFNFDEPILVMMCWCNHDKFLKEKRKGLGFGGSYASWMFHNAADGYWGLESHQLSRQDLVDRALTFNADSIRPILSHWQKLNVSGLFVGTNYHGPSGRFAHELNADDLSSYFNSRGEAYFQNIIDKVYSPELQSLMFRANKLMTKMKVFSTETGDMTMFNLIFTPGSYLCIVAPHGDFNDLDGWIHEIENLPKSEVADEFLQLAKDIKIYRETTFLPVKEMEPLAILDLVVWKDEHVVSCEVKAPNDRLKPHQKAQLERDNNNGIASWVIEVEEA